jgi:hypothetical protein
VISFLFYNFESLIEQVFSHLDSFSSHQTFECTLFGFFFSSCSFVSNIDFFHSN